MHTYKYTYKHICIHTSTYMLLYAKMVGKGWSFPSQDEWGIKADRAETHLVHIHVYVYQVYIVQAHIQQPYAHIQTHIQTRIQTHIQTHIHAHMHTYKHIQAAIRKNGREGLVFPVLGRVCVYLAI